MRRGFRFLVGVAVLLCALATPVVSQSVPIYTGGTGKIVFGVSPYGLPQPGVPTYIPNNVTGLVDILASPGGTFLTANPVVANNIQEIPLVGLAALPAFGFQIGGGNIHGPFGAGAVSISGPRVGFSLQDPVAGGGSASYAIASWNANFTDPVGYAGAFGTFLSVAGTLPNLNTAAVASLRTRITSLNPLSPFFGGLDMPQLVLANSRVGPLLYSFVALGGAGAAMLVDNAALGTFRGLAINNGAIVIPAGDVFTAVSTLTIYADPADLAVLDPFLHPDLILATGTSLPAASLIGTVPEPGTSALLVMGLLSLALVGKRAKRLRV